MRDKRNKHLGLEIPPDIHHKLHYIARYEGRSANAQVLWLIRRCIRDFERTEGEIPPPEPENKHAAPSAD